MTVLSKLQIRGIILRLLDNANDAILSGEPYLEYFLREIQDIEDIPTIVNVIMKEYPRLNEIECDFVAKLFRELNVNDLVGESAAKIIKTSGISDDLKYKYLELLGNLRMKDKLSEIRLEDSGEKRIVDIETEKLLEKASFNPETMLDFLDFISNVSATDADLLVQSLNKDYTGNDLANILYPILYSDFPDNFKIKIINILSDSKSPLAIPPFRYLQKVSDNQNILNAANLGLKKLKLAGASEEDGEIYHKTSIEKYKVKDCYTTIPDGSGSQAILINRADENGLYIMLAVVINDRTGIVDCFGFYNILQNSVLKIISKFYEKEGKYKVSPKYVKTAINNAFEKTIENKDIFPYEYICWSTILSDIQPLEDNIKEYVEKNCENINIAEKEMYAFLTQEYTLRWFIAGSDNKVLKNLLDDIYNLQNPKMDEIHDMIRAKINNIFTDDISDLWLNRLYNLAYILLTNNKKNEANIVYAIATHNNLFEAFKIVLIQRSIFSHFVQVRENIVEYAKTTNIFRQKNSNESKYDLKRIENLIKIIKKRWIDG